MNINRRTFLKISGGTAATLAVSPRLAFGAAGDRDVLISLYLRGGMDGLNVVVPYTDTRYYSLRPVLAVPPPGESGGAVDLDGRFGLHPSLASLKPIYDAGDLAIVHAAGSPDESRSHFDAQDYMELGHFDKQSSGTGWLGRYLDSVTPLSASAFRGLAVGNRLPIALRAERTAPVALASIEDFALVSAYSDELGAIRDTLDSLYDGTSELDQVAAATFSAVDDLAAADPGALPVDNGAVYPATPFGQQMQQLAQLIKADVGLEAAQVEINGWDHHDGEIGALPPMLSDLALGLSAFYTDLGTTMSRVSLVTMTEFGRRAYENASGGTDHGHGSVMFAMGRNVRGGQVWGEWPGLAASDLYRGEDLEVTTDWRDVLAEMLMQRGDLADPERVFPGYAPASIGLFS